MEPTGTQQITRLTRGLIYSSDVICSDSIPINKSAQVNQEAILIGLWQSWAGKCKRFNSSSPCSLRESILRIYKTQRYIACIHLLLASLHCTGRKFPCDIITPCLPYHFSSSNFLSLLLQIQIKNIYWYFAGLKPWTSLHTHTGGQCPLRADFFQRLRKLSYKATPGTAIWHKH